MIKMLLIILIFMAHPIMADEFNAEEKLIIEKMAAQLMRGCAKYIAHDENVNVPSEIEDPEYIAHKAFEKAKMFVLSRRELNSKQTKNGNLQVYICPTTSLRDGCGP